jgi:hypothetical protein
MRGAKVFICCSPDARVGVSTTARLLTDYHLFRGEHVEGFDTDPHEPRYGVHFPGLVKTIDALDIRGQISLFDRLLSQDGAPKIVDVWHRSYARFFETVREIGFMEEARERGISLILLFHADATQAALARAHDLNRSWPEQRLLIVDNEGAAALGPNSREILSQYPATGKFVIAGLQGPVAKALDDPSLSLSEFLRAPPPAMSIVIRAALKAWITPVFMQFRSFELRLEMESDLFSG